MLSVNQVDAAAVQQQVHRVLQSRVFERAARSQRLLRYLVEAALADPPVVPKELVIALDVFDRDVTYDPAVDATVRVEVSRLRSRLREYFDEEGRHDPWRIDLPKGAYAVTFTQTIQTTQSLPAPGTQLPVTIASASSLADPPAPAAPTAALAPSLLLAHRQGIFWALGLFLLVAGGLVAWRASHSPTAQTSPSAPISLAILPLVNRTGDPGLNVTVDGLTDDLIRQLSQVPALRLIARSTMFRYRDRTGEAEAIARALHVDMVATGELRRSPDHLSLAVEVVNARDGSVVLDRDYIADAGDLRPVQGELQRDILTRLHVEASALNPGRALRSVTSSPEAYAEFLKADALSRSMAPGDLHQAIPHAERAVALDPQFDLAWSTLAADHLVLGLYFEPPRDHMPLARHFAQQALHINPHLGEAHGDLGVVDLIFDWNMAAAEAEMGTAGAEAAAVSALACTARLLESAGHPRRAEEMLSRLLTYDPQSIALIAELGCVDFYRGDYEAALSHYREALAADPSSPISYWGLGKTLNAEGKYPEAQTVLHSFQQRNGFEPPLLTAEIGYSLGASGNRREALATIRQLTDEQSRLFVDPYLVSIVFLSLGDRDNAFHWLDTALEQRSAFLISILTEPKWQPIRTDPRFARIVDRMLHSHPG